MHYYNAFALFLCLTLSSLASQDLTPKLDQLFEAAYTADKPGASILIARGDKVIYERQVGLANVEHSIPLGPKSVFSAGSITKQFTAAAILQLEEQGKLNCGDPLAKYLPSLALPEAPITLHQLLTHTSGVPDYPRIKEIRQNIRNEPSVTEIINRVLEEPLDFSPGTDYRYSNTGFLLLGKVIEAASGMPYEAYLRNNILKPAKMEASVLADFNAIIQHRTTSYTSDDDFGILRAPSHAYSYAAGGLFTTPRDLLKWKIALQAGKILNELAYSKMFAATGPASDAQCYGWEVNEIGGVLSYEHTGFEPGYKASSVYLPAQDLYLIVMQNTEYGSPTPTLLNAAALCLGAPYPSPADELVADQEILKQFVGRYAFPNDQERIVKLTDGQLSYQAPGGLPSPLYVHDSLSLFFEQGYRQLHLSPAVAGVPKTLTYQNRRHRRIGTLLSEAVSPEKRAIEVSLTDLEAYVGEYQTEHFLISISIADGRLLASPEGSDPLPLTPYAKDKFFIPAIGAELAFKATGSRYTDISILLEGELHRGIRK